MKGKFSGSTLHSFDKIANLFGQVSKLKGFYGSLQTLRRLSVEFRNTNKVSFLVKLQFFWVVLDCKYTYFFNKRDC